MYGVDTGFDSLGNELPYHRLIKKGTRQTVSDNSFIGTVGDFQSPAESYQRNGQPKDLSIKHTQGRPTYITFIGDK